MATSWVPSVTPTTEFSLANLPFGIITTPSDPSPHAAVAIGASVLDLKVLSSHPAFPALFPPLAAHPDVFAQPTLNAFAALGRPVHRQVRAALRDLLSTDTAHPAVLRDAPAAERDRVLLPQSQVHMHLPMQIGDYTDFYAGYHHAYRVGCLFRGPEAALQPNYTHLPVGYHGRASSVVVSGTGIRRPTGQMLLDGEPTTGPSRRLDFELELGCFVARGNRMGEKVGVEEAEECIFGYVLLNDWSARDVQAWEYVPLGPFCAKNFGTTVGAWVVLADALEGFRTRGVQVEGRGEVQGYLREGREEAVFDVRLEVDLTTPEGDTTTISRTNAKHLLWSFPQMIAHHTLGGCPMRTGDLLGSGTISGPGGPEERGSLLEMTEGGKKEVLLYGMDARKFLKDGDTITLRGWCGQDGARVGFGECRGRIYSA
ncbi:hypothetical protein B0T18DRAFT_174157 [Schizothecium vesticola]|uniref:Fumarylacetoacetase n=1 Tax=Schizothecium vesticola TaxID=314040 RepID=A0AA40K252_9PEZI|nr:hypothetical protein B0T18DRAFT_174157 [Schizothecium vesticola]